MAQLPLEATGIYFEGDVPQSPVDTSWTECETQTSDPVHVPVTTLTPMVPKKLARYTAGDHFVPTFNHIIAPLHFCDPEVSFECPMPPGWVKHMHPEGNLYYYNHDLQLVTDVDVSNHAMLVKILQAVAMFRERMENLPPNMVAPVLRANHAAEGWHCGIAHWELFLEMNAKDPGEFRYYVADWKQECLFWVEDIPEDPLSTSGLDLDSAATYDHLRLMLRWQFWRHAEFFPAHRSLPSGSYDLLRAVLLYSANDRMTSVDSTVSHTAQDLRQFLKILPEQQNTIPECAPYITAMVARHWIEIWDSRMHNLHGQPAARLTRCQSRFFEPEQKGSIKLITKIICWIFLFNQPKTFYYKLCDMWVDKTVYIDQWRSLLRAMQEEWTTTGFMATVILATNMSFLGIDKLDSVELPLEAQTASVVSTILSIGSIVSGMLLVRRHRELDAENCTADEASDYMTACAYYKGTGLLGAAALFSAPRALFLWSLVLFVSALLSFSFCQSSKIFSPFIAFATATIMLIIFVQLWYFNTKLTKSKSSTWTIPDEYMRPSGKPPLLRHGDTNRRWPMAPESLAQESPSTTTVVETPYGVTALDESPWRRVRRQFTRRTTYPMSDVEYGRTYFPRVFRDDFGDGGTAIYASPDDIELHPLPEIERPPASRRRSTGISSLYSEPGPSNSPQTTWVMQPHLQHPYQLQVAIPGMDIPDGLQRDTRGVHRRDTYG